MHAIFSRTRKVVVVVGPSLQRTKLLRNQQPALSQPSQRRHFLSHLLPCGLVASSSATRGFFATTLRNNHLKLELGNVLESRAGFFGFRLPSKGLESEGFTGFQKRGWYCVSFSSSHLLIEIVSWAKSENAERLVPYLLLISYAKQTSKIFLTGYWNFW